MATPIVAQGWASTSSTPTQQHFAAHNALSLAMLYLNRGDLPAARRKAVQALATIKRMREVGNGLASKYACCTTERRAVA